MYVGPDGRGGTAVWVTYTDFGVAGSGQNLRPTAQIKAVRCSADLSDCTDPIPVSRRASGFEKFVQFSDVTVDSKGRAYVSWTEGEGRRP